MLTVPTTDKLAKETDIKSAAESLLRGTATLPTLELHVKSARQQHEWQHGVQMMGVCLHVEAV